VGVGHGNAWVHLVNAAQVAEVESRSLLVATAVQKWQPAVGNGKYDIITVGGGLGGATLAKAMAEQGARVLVLEWEIHFKDRVRGEQMHPWGVAETKALGIYDLLAATCGHELPLGSRYVGRASSPGRACIDRRCGLFQRSLRLGRAYR
jgi:hypothetical protein